MASNITQAVNSENPMATPINVKNLVVGDQSQRKMALGDIKNAPVAFDKSPVKNMANADRKTVLGNMKSGPNIFGKSPLKMDESITTDEFIESASASSKYVDYSDMWCNNLALSDAEITRWIDMLNSARSMQMSPPPRPPTPPSLFEDIEIPEPVFEFEELVPPPLPEDDEDEDEDEPEHNGLPSSDSSMYYSFDGTFELEL